MSRPPDDYGMLLAHRAGVLSYYAQELAGLARIRNDVSAAELRTLLGQVGERIEVRAEELQLTGIDETTERLRKDAQSLADRRRFKRL